MVPNRDGPHAKLLNRLQLGYVTGLMKGNALTARERGAGSARRASRAPSSRVSRLTEKRRKRHQLLARGGILAAAIALPTVAAQGQWSDFKQALGLAEERVALTPMPFETAGESFPGSAFYYLEDAPRLGTDLSDR